MAGRTQAEQWALDLRANCPDANGTIQAANLRLLQETLGEIRNGTKIKGAAELHDMAKHGSVAQAKALRVACLSLADKLENPEPVKTKKKAKQDK